MRHRINCIYKIRDIFMNREQMTEDGTISSCFSFFLIHQQWMDRNVMLSLSTKRICVSASIMERACHGPCNMDKEKILCWEFIYFYFFFSLPRIWLQQQTLSISSLILRGSPFVLGQIFKDLAKRQVEKLSASVKASRCVRSNAGRFMFIIITGTFHFYAMFSFSFRKVKKKKL